MKPETIDVQDVLEASAAAISHQVGEAAGAIEYDMQAPPMVSDRQALEQIFGNLLDNAVKYRSPSRSLRLKIRSRAIAGDRIAIEISDNGRGIAARDHERIFDLFRRSGSQDQPGEGIGLAHVRSVVRSLGGDISVTSELDQGTTFKIILPRALKVETRSNAA